MPLKGNIIFSISCVGNKKVMEEGSFCLTKSASIESVCSQRTTYLGYIWKCKISNYYLYLIEGNIPRYSYWRRISCSGDFKFFLLTVSYILVPEHGKQVSSVKKHYVPERYASWHHMHVTYDYCKKNNWQLKLQRESDANENMSDSWKDNFIILSYFIFMHFFLSNLTSFIWRRAN